MRFIKSSISVLFFILAFLTTKRLYAHTIYRSPKDDATKTYLIKITELFNQGTKAKFSKYEDKLLAGRCFHGNEPNLPVAAYFIVTKKTGDAGPLDASEIGYSALMQEVRVVPDNYFDSPLITLNDFYINNYRYPLTLSTPDTYILAYTGTKEIGYFRQNENYIVSFVLDRFSRVEFACYFFERKEK